MNSKILAKAQMIIDEKRSFAESTAKRFFDIAMKNEEFKDLYNEIKTEEIQIAKQEAFGQITDYSKLNKLLEKQEFILNKMGINGTDLKPNYECLYCNDTGYKNGIPCDCLKYEINKQLLEFSGFCGPLPSFSDKHINSLAFGIMEKWCNLDNEKYNVIISGNIGVGKTYLTQCIANEMIKRSHLVLFTTAFNLNNSLLNYHISMDNKRSELLEPYLSTEVLIIDDLGTEPLLKNVTKEYLYLIINERSINHLRTIITTNLDLNEICDRYDERIFSRLRNKKNSLVINLKGDDIRLKTNI